MKILVACEESGTVRDAFRALGHDAWSCDTQVCSADPTYHYHCDVRHVLYQPWDLIVAHPPCTYLTNTGVSWLTRKPGRWDALTEAADFFKLFLTVDCPRVAIENPIPHKYAIALIGRKYDQLIQPYQFGHAERKATCFWLKGLPPLCPTDDCYAAMRALPANQAQRLHYLPPSPERAKLRSKTYPGIAAAIAAQWGVF